MDARCLIAPHTAACLAADPCPHDAAEAAAAAQRARLGPHGETCQATVAHRDEPRRACLDCPKRAQPGSPWCAEHD